MMEGPDGGTPSTPSSPSLESWVGSMDGPGFIAERSEPETEGPSTPETGAAPDGATPAIGSEGTSDAAPVERSPTEPAAAPPDTAAPASTDDDPLKDATPLTFTVDGQARTIEGIKVLGAHGAVVEAAFLPKIAQVFSEHAHLVTEDRAKYQRIQELERLTEWRTKDDKGNDLALSGLKGVEAQRVLLGRTMARAMALGQIFDASPVQLLAQDEHGAIVWDQAALKHLATEIRLAEIQSEQTVRTHLATLSSSLKETAERTQEDATLPGRLWQAIEAPWLAKHPELTAQDRQFLQAQLPRYIRVATPEEAKTEGRTVVDPSFYEVIKDRAELRATNAKQLQSTVAATSQADKDNRARLAAAAVGKPKGQPVKVAAAPKPPTPAQERETRAEDAWDLAQKAAARMVRRGATATP